MNKIPKNAFRNCWSLKSIKLPDTVLSIGDTAFYGCTSLKDASIGLGVKFIGLSAFCNDDQLSSIDRLNDANGSHTFDIVCDYAFAGTGLLSANLALRSSSIYTFWGDSCFEGCQHLTDVRVLSANYLSKDMFKGCINLSSVTFDKNFMAYTYPGVFSGCKSLQTITLPGQLMFITTDMFRDCLALRSVYFNEQDADGRFLMSNVKLIQKDAFYGCESLKRIDFPYSIQSLDQIDDGAFNGTDANVKSMQFAFPGLKYTDFGSPLFEDELFYGKPIEIYEPTELFALLHYSFIANKPFLLIVSFKFNFVYSTDHEIQTVYLHDVPSKKTASYLPYQNDNDPFFNSRMETSPFEFDGKFQYKGIDYDMTDKSIIIAQATVDLGTALPYTGLDLKVRAEIMEDDKFDAAMKYIGVMKPDGSLVDDRDPPDDLTQTELDKLSRNSTYKALAQKISRYLTSTGEQQPSIISLVKNYNTRLKQKYKPSIRDINMPPSTLEEMLYVVGNTTTFAFRNCPFQIYVSYGTKTTLPKVFKNIDFDTQQKIRNKSNRDQTVAELYKALYSKVMHAGANDNMAVIGTDVKVDTNGNYNHIFLDILNKNGFYRAFPHFSSTTAKANIANSKPLTIVTSTGNPRDPYASIQHQKIKMVLTKNTSIYTPPVQYESDMGLPSSFKVGHWYYRAQNIHKYARQKGIPCLFIYSLLGCGPCAIYQKNVWNNAVFQDWAAKQNFLLCGMEVQKQPLFDRQLAFCTDELSPYAENFAKTDKGEEISSKTPNVFGEVFSRSKTPDGSFSSNLMTPVLVFMDEDGKCYDYTFHNIGLIIQNFGVGQVLDFIKRMCLYYFDNNTIEGAKYVVDCDKPFDIADFPKPAQSANPYIVADKLVDFKIATPAEFNKLLTTIQRTHGYMYQDSSIEEQYKQQFGPEYTSFPYLGGCWWIDIDYIDGLFDSTIQNAKTAQELMDNYVNKVGYRFRFGQDLYTLSFGDTYCILHQSTPCGFDDSLFIPIWTKVS